MLLHIDKFFHAFKPNRPNMKAIKGMFDYEKDVNSRPSSTVYTASPLQTERNSLYMLRILMWERAKGELNGIAALSDTQPASEESAALATKIRGMITEIDYLIHKIEKR